MRSVTAHNRNTNRNAKGVLSFLRFTFCMALFFSLSSCTIGRYVGEGEHVLHHTELDVQMADSSEVTPEVRDALKRARNYYTQRPNSKFLGVRWLPVGKWVYCFATDTTSNIWNNYFHRIGQAPVVYDEERAVQTTVQLQRLLESKGCFGSTVDFDTISVKGRNLTLAYRVHATRRRIVDEVTYMTDNPDVRRLLDQWQPSSPLQAGQPYDQELIAAERNRIVANLRDAGYYYASPQLVTFRVDTTYSSSMLSIDVLVDSRSLRVYHINNIYVYPNSTAGLRSQPSAFDTLIYTYPSATRRIDYQFVHDSPMSIRPQTISRALMLFPGMTYRPRYITNSYNSLLALRNFKYINIEFVESPSSTDTLPLVDANVRLINATQQRLSLAVELTNASPLGSQDSNYSFISSGNLGVQTSVEYQHKNIFGGAELLRIKGSLLLELPKNIFSSSGSGFYDYFNSLETSLEASLDMPVFMLPFSSRFLRSGMRPHTLFTLGGSYQYRYYFERVLANTSFGYTWQHSRRASNQLLPVEMTFVRMLDIDDAFAARIASTGDLRLKYQYSSHFILDARYDYAYSNQQYGTRKNFTNIHATLESAGNLLAATAPVLGATADDNGILQLLGVPFAQYVRANLELTRYIYFADRSTFVARLLLGIGIPYGNSVSMPYEKSSFGGGPTTMRAWQLRHLGPGSYSADDILERVGDLQLVVNLEARFPIAGILEGAAFTDIGNVWLLNPSDQYPGGEIQPANLARQIAVGTGLGLRFNLSIATLRLDFAIPLLDPGYSDTLRFRPPHWRFNQIVTNFGINYPF